MTARVLVVGAGIAGLTAAWRLQRVGYEVEVFEREAFPGGRMRSERHGEFLLDRGAQFIASGYRNLHALSAELGIADRIRPVATASNAILRDGRLEPGDYGSPSDLLHSRLLSPRARLRLARLPFELWRHRKILEPLRPERAAALDGDDLATWARRTVGEEVLESLLAPAFSSTFDSDPEHLSGVFALLALRFVTAGFRLQAFEGGTGLLTRTLADQLPVRLGWEVRSVATDARGARVEFVTPSGLREQRADAVVVAVPGSRVLGICPELTEAEQSFFSQVHYAAGGIVHLLLDEPPETLPFYGVAFPRSAGLDLYGLAVDHHKPGAAPRGAGLVNCALTETAARRLAGEPDEAWIDCALDALAATPVGRLRPREAVVHRWDPMLPQFRAGYVRRLAAFLPRSERSPRLAFAGDYLVGPYTEAALTSGMRAANEVARALES
ncbi:MAG: FAD-dependent oxidoreductase [Myxococcales bacterium]|nr:FAD-dependent oxidoreductase [Myxococcales bacterium]